MNLLVQRAQRPCQYYRNQPMATALVCTPGLVLSSTPGDDYLPFTDKKTSPFWCQDLYQSSFTQISTRHTDYTPHIKPLRAAAKNFLRKLAQPMTALYKRVAQVNFLHLSARYSVLHMQTSVISIQSQAAIVSKQLRVQSMAEFFQLQTDQCTSKKNKKHVHLIWLNSRQQLLQKTAVRERGDACVLLGHRV